MSMPPEGLRAGPLGPWIDGAAVLSYPPFMGATENQVTDPNLAEEVAVSASEILYWASGRKFPGISPVINVRPVARPTDLDTRQPFGLTYGGYYAPSLGSAMAGGMAAQGPLSHYGNINPPEVDLGFYPVVSIDHVLIDGELIPAEEYELAADFRTLVRILPTVDYDPTDRFGWPTSQRNDLPDTQPGTFSVYFRWGRNPPVSGRRAARRLAYEFALGSMGRPNALPARVTQTARQGVTTQVRDIIDYIAEGRTGIPEIDFFLRYQNPHGVTENATVWSPDLGRPRRLISGA